eukprot:33079-Prymnesium_polylepis.1
MTDIGFLGSLERFNQDAINDETVELLYPYLTAPDFTTEDAKKVAGALGGLCAWVRALCTYRDVSKEVKPKLEALREAETMEARARESLRNEDTCLVKVEELRLHLSRLHEMQA